MLMGLQLRDQMMANRNQRDKGPFASITNHRRSWRQIGFHNPICLHWTKILFWCLSGFAKFNYIACTYYFNTRYLLTNLYLAKSSITSGQGWTFAIWTTTHIQQLKLAGNGLFSHGNFAHCWCQLYCSICLPTLYGKIDVLPDIASFTIPKRYTKEAKSSIPNNPISYKPTQNLMTHEWW